MRKRALLAVIGMVAMTQVYPAAGVVVDRQEVTATVRTMTGYEYNVPGDDWCRGDVCAMLMRRAGEDGISDDEVLDSRYVGTVDGFLDIMMDAMVEQEILWEVR